MLQKVGIWTVQKVKFTLMPTFIPQDRITCNQGCWFLPLEWSPAMLNLHNYVIATLWTASSKPCNKPEGHTNTAVYFVRGNGGRWNIVLLPTAGIRIAKVNHFKKLIYVLPASAPCFTTCCVFMLLNPPYHLLLYFYVVRGSSKDSRITWPRHSYT